MVAEDIGHALLTRWATWFVQSGNRCCLWYPTPKMLRSPGGNRVTPIVPSSGMMPVLVKAVQAVVNKLPRTTQTVIYSKYMLPGDDSAKWVELSISRRTWYRQIADARRKIGSAANNHLTDGT